MPRSFGTATVGALALAMAMAWASGPAQAQTADAIYAGGPIVTVNDAQPSAEAVAVKDGKILAVGTRAEIDDALLGRHPTRDDLDKASTEIPVIAVHISGHFSAMNGAGLAKVGYTATTKDPQGGLIRRRPGTKEPNGVLEAVST